ncbi:MAG: tetratricopeptide repeat protein [Planctomycetota bacterium]
MFAAWMLAGALLAGSSSAQALDEVRAALVVRPDDVELRRTALRLAFAHKRWSDVLAWTDGRSRFRGERARALFFLARYREALELLDAADDEEAFLVLDALEALGELERHDRVLAEVRARLGAADARVAAAEGRVALREGRFQEACERFGSALASDPWCLAAHFGLGRARLGAGDVPGARVALEEHRRLVPLFDELDFAQRGVELDPAHGPNHAKVGDVERAIGRLPLAHAAYLRALEHSTGAERVPVVLRLARFLEEDVGDSDAAVGLLGAELQADFEPRLAVRRGDVLARAERLEEALAAYRAVLRQRPDDAAVLRRIAELEAR